MAEDFHVTDIEHAQYPFRTIYPRYAITGYVVYWAGEPDGDTHFRIANTDSASDPDFVVCEIIPEYPMSHPSLHQLVTVYGIYRVDSEHGWVELHPVLGWRGVDKAGNPVVQPVGFAPIMA